MAAWKTLWRRVGGMAIACMLAVLVVAPSMDSAMCSNDDPVTTIQQSAQAYDVRSSLVEAQQQDRGHAICPHGHCHHGIVYLDATALAPSDARISANRLTPPSMTALMSGPTSRLEDPPRA